MGERKAERTFSEQEVVDRLGRELPHWRLADGHITRRYKTAGWKSTLMVVNTIGHLAEAAWHHPDLSVSYSSVEVRLQNHAARGITDKDFDLAVKIEAVIQWRPGEEDGALEGTPTDPKYAYIIYD